MRRHSFNNLSSSALLGEASICQLLLRVNHRASPIMKTMLMKLLLLLLLSSSLLLSTNNSILIVNGFVLEPTTTSGRSGNLLVNARGGAYKTTRLMMLRPTSKKIRQQLYDHQSSNNKKNKKIFHFMEIPRGGGGGGESNSSGCSVEKSNNNNEDANANASTQQQQQQFQGRALLCLVAVLYGTLNVSLRLVYQLPDPPSASVLSATRGWLATGCFVPLLALNNNDNNKQEKRNDDEDKSSTKDPLIHLEEEGEKSGNNNNWQQFWLAGFELAVWNFLAQGLLNIGLLSTGSARASFLTQTSVVMTPIISFLFGQVVPWTVWVGCCIALGGLTLLSGGGGAAAAAAAEAVGSSSMLSFSQGDWWVLGGAFSWSLYLFRLSKIGSKFQEVQLQATKTFLLAILYSIWVISSFVGSSGGGTITTVIFGSWSTSLIAWLTLLYSALGPGTIADIIQQQGQKFVSASEANVLLSMEPVFAAICAWLLLGEISTTKELIGGAMILVAALVATTSPSSSTTTEPETTEN